MDLGTSLVWCVSVATLGGIVLSFLRFFKSKNNNPGGATKSSNVALSEQFTLGLRKEFVSEKTCIANMKAIETSINLTKEILVGKIDGLGTALVNDLKPIINEAVKKGLGR